MDLDLLALNLTGERLYANNKYKNVLSALVKFPYSFFVSAVIAAPGVGETIYYYHNDHLGTPQVLTDDQGQVVWRGDYKPFGEVDVVVEQVRNDCRFPGQYYDQETSLHYNYFRNYHPGIGRYAETDPFGVYGLLVAKDPNVFAEAAINPYGYVQSNPIKALSPFGSPVAADVLPQPLPWVPPPWTWPAIGSMIAPWIGPAIVGGAVITGVILLTPSEIAEDECEDFDLHKHCVRLFVLCDEQQWKGDCGQCLLYCKTQGEWDYLNCPPGSSRWE